MKDPRNVGDIPPVSFNISPVGASFVRFQLLSYYGNGGGLQYFSACPTYTECSDKSKGNQSTYDYVKLYIGYFSNRIPVCEGIFTLENLTF